MANDDLTAIFGVEVEDENVETSLKKIETRLDAIEANRAFDRLENALNRVGTAAGETAHSNTKGLAGIVAVGTAIGGAVLGAINTVIAGLGQLKAATEQYIASAVQLSRTVETKRAILLTLAAAQGTATEKTAGFITELEDAGITSRSAIQSLTLMVQANLDLADATDLAKIAQNKGRIVGLNSSQAFENILFAVAKLDTEMLRSTGILVNNQEAAAKYAKTIDGASAGTLTFKQRQQALIEAIKEEAKGVGGAYEAASKTIGGALLSFPRVVEQLQLKIGETFQPAFDVFTRQKMALTKSFFDFVKENSEGLEELSGILVSFAKGILLIFEQVTSALPEANFDAIVESVRAFAESIIGTALQIGVVIDQLKSVVATTKEARAEAQPVIDAFMTLFQTINPIAGLIKSITDNISTASGVTGELYTGAQRLGEAFSSPKEFAEGLVDAMRTLNQLIAFAVAGWTGFIAGVQPGVDALAASLEALSQAAQGNWTEAIAANKEAEEALKKGFFDVEAAREAASQSMLESARKIQEADEKLADTFAETAEEIKEVDEAAQDLGDTVEELDPRAEQAAEALVALKKRLARQLIERDIKEKRAEVDREIALSRRREDIARRTAKTLEKIEDAAEKAREKTLEAAGKQREKFDKDAGKARKQSAKDQAKTLVDVERDFRRRLRDIRDRFLVSAREAQIKNDAIAFLQAKRAADDQVRELKKSRERGESDIQREYKDRNAELEESIKESRAAFEEDLQERLAAIDKNAEEQVERFKESLKEQEEEFQISQKRQEEDRQLALKRQEEDLKRSLEFQLEDLKDKYGEFVDVTADALLEQSQEYLDTYGTGGTAEMTMKEFFTKQGERLAELKAQSEEALAVSAAVSAATGAGGGASSLALTPVMSLPPPPPGSLGHGIIGQGGLSSLDLATARRSVNLPGIIGDAPVSRPQRGATGGGGGRQVLEFNFEGVEPYLQRVATQTFLEAYRNMMDKRAVAQ